MMLKLIDRLRIRGVRGDLTRDEELKKLDMTLERIKYHNAALLHASGEEFSKLCQKNKTQLSVYRIEFNKLKSNLKKELAELNNNYRRSLENLKTQLKRNMIYSY